MTGLAIAVFALGACGASDRQTPTLELPLVAPDGAQGIVADFIEVCSVAMSDQQGAIALLSERDYVVPDASDLVQMAAMGGHMSEDADGNTIQIIPIDFPHVNGVTCNVYGIPLEEMPDVSAVERIAGLQGTMSAMGFGEDRSKLGRFSGIGPDGYPIAVQVMTSDDSFFNLSMTTTRPVDPADTTQE